MGNPIIIPHPKQIEFLSNIDNECFFGGARGGGKSAALAYDAAFKYRATIDGQIKVSVDYPEYRALLIRRKYVDIEMNFKPICDMLYKPYGGHWMAKAMCYIFPSGAKIHLAHCDTYGDVEKYIGGNFHYLGVEEANQFPENWIEKIKSSVRSTNPELTPFKRYTSNPGGVGHLWLKKYFYERCEPKNVGTLHSDLYNIDYPDLVSGDAYIDEFGNSRRFIPALVFDNPTLLDNDPSYVRNLMSIRDPVLRSMWLLGSWDVQTGAFFDEWSAFYHIVPAKTLKKFEEEKGQCRLYRAIDYGSSAPFVCLFVQIFPDGHAIVFDEIYQAGLTPSQQARMMLEKSKKWGISEDEFDLTICDPAMRARTHAYLNERVSVVQMYLDEGMTNIHFGDNDRIPGWQILREYLHIPDFDESSDEQRSMPFLQFTEMCEHCIESFPAAVRSQKNPEDVDTLCDDHALDSARYLFKFIDRPYIKKEQEKKGWRDRIRENSKRKPVLSGDLAWCN